MITQEQLKDILDRTEKLHHYLNIPQKQIEFEEEQLRTQAPDFWDDVKRAQEQMKKVKGIEKWLNDYKAVRTAADELQLAFDFYHDEMVTEEEVDADYQHALKHGLCAEDQLRCRWYREPGLGTDAHANVYALGRGSWS